MTTFNEKTNRDEYEQRSSQMESYLNKAEKIIINTNVKLEGNAFYFHNTLTRFPELYNKQLNLFWCGKQAPAKICEIGFNAGHSSMLMLLGNDSPSLDFTIFDIGEHKYTAPCLSYMMSLYPQVKFEYVQGDSTITMPRWINSNQLNLGTYDVVHIDGGHTEHCIFNDMKNVNLLVKKDGIVIIDDTQVKHINKWVDLYLSTGLYTELHLLDTIGYRHRILQKISVDNQLKPNIQSPSVSLWRRLQLLR
jgi:hypothetical protein